MVISEILTYIAEKIGERVIDETFVNDKQDSLRGCIVKIRTQFSIETGYLKEKIIDCRRLHGAGY